MLLEREMCIRDRYWGKGDKKTVEKILGLAERCTLIISLIFFLISFSMPTTVMKIFTDNPDTIAAGSAVSYTHLDVYKRQALSFRYFEGHS